MPIWPKHHGAPLGGGSPRTWPAQPSRWHGPPGARRFTHSPRSIVPALGQAVKPILTGRVDGWPSEYAHTLGEQAFVYGLNHDAGGAHPGRLR